MHQNESAFDPKQLYDKFQQIFFVMKIIISIVLLSAFGFRPTQEQNSFQGQNQQGQNSNSGGFSLQTEVSSANQGNGGVGQGMGSTANRVSGSMGQGMGNSASGGGGGMGQGMGNSANGGGGGMSQGMGNSANGGGGGMSQMAGNSGNDESRIRVAADGGQSTSGTMSGQGGTAVASFSADYYNYYTALSEIKVCLGTINGAIRKLPGADATYDLDVFYPSPLGIIYLYKASTLNPFGGLMIYDAKSGRPGKSQSSGMTSNPQTSTGGQSNGGPRSPPQGGGSPDMNGGNRPPSGFGNGNSGGGRTK